MNNLFPSNWGRREKTSRYASQVLSGRRRQDVKFLLDFQSAKSSNPSWFLKQVGNKQTHETGIKYQL